jgi:hypothetical protein
MKKIYLLSLLLLGMLTARAQEAGVSSDANNPGNTKFLLTGYAFTGMEFEGSEESTFGETSFNPIFLWKFSDKIFFESELEIEIEDEVEFGFEYANVNYILNKYMTFTAGKFLTPFGTFQERLHPAWINKVVEKPLGFGGGGMPGTEVGFELRGGLPMGSAKMNYALYVSNGPLLETEGITAGKLEYENFADNNKNKAFGGRIGILPIPNSSLEIGGSFQTANVGDQDSKYQDVNAKLFALDFSYVKSVPGLKGLIDLKGQWNNVAVDEISYELPDGNDYTFDNTHSAFYGQLAFRPQLVKNKFLKKLEFVGRYSEFKKPDESLWEENEKWVTLGLNYWTSWRTVIKLNYQIETPEDEDSINVFLIRIVTGF